LCVFVSIQALPGAADRYRAALLDNAAAAKAAEPGCVQFDVAEDETVAGLFHLYEVYADADAFAAHLGSAHYAEYRVVADECTDPDSRRLVKATQLVSQK